MSINATEVRSGVQPKSGSSWWISLVAETKKLTRRKGVMAFTLLGTVGVIIITFVILEAYHLSNPVKYSPVGGVGGFNKVVLILS